MTMPVGIAYLLAIAFAFAIANSHSYNSVLVITKYTKKIYENRFFFH